MAHEHRYEIKLTWTGAAQEPTQNYKGYSREDQIEAPGERDHGSGRQRRPI